MLNTIFSKVETKTDFLGSLYVIGLLLLAAWALFMVLRGLSDWYATSHRKKYYDLNKKICSKVSKHGQSITDAYSDYLDVIDTFDLNRVIHCSSSVVSNSRWDEAKYILKYSNIGSSKDDMEQLESISSFMDDYKTFIIEINEARKHIKKSLPLVFRLFVSSKTLPYTVCNLSPRLMDIKKPYLSFLYVSPAGRSSNENRILIDDDIIAELIQTASKDVSRKGHAKRQRGIMTNDLRDAIKLRDNYTCCICGNSVYDEPNLLLEVDHIVPISKGGKTEASNLQTLCWRCNRLKGDK